MFERFDRGTGPVRRRRNGRRLATVARKRSPLNPRFRPVSGRHREVRNGEDAFRPRGRMGFDWEKDPRVLRQVFDPSQAVMTRKSVSPSDQPSWCRRVIDSTRDVLLGWLR